MHESMHDTENPAIHMQSITGSIILRWASVCLSRIATHKADVIQLSFLYHKPRHTHKRITMRCRRHSVHSVQRTKQPSIYLFTYITAGRKEVIHRSIASVVKIAVHKICVNADRVKVQCRSSALEALCLCQRTQKPMKAPLRHLFDGLIPSSGLSIQSCTDC